MIINNSMQTIQNTLYPTLDIFVNSDVDVENKNKAMNAYQNLFIKKSEELSNRLNNYLRYTTEKLPIQDKVTINLANVNSQIINSYESIIVDSKIGYMFSQPIATTLNKFTYENQEQKFEFHNELIKNYKNNNAWDDTNSEVGKQSGITGIGVKVLYIDEDLNVRSKKCDSWEFVFVGSSIEDIDLAVRSYPWQGVDADGNTQYIQVYEIWDKNYHTKFIYNGDELNTFETTEHFFGIVPVIPYANNNERISDFKKVKTLIDAYNMITSLMVDDNENIARTILKIIGAEIDEDLRDRLKESGVLNLLGANGQVNAEFLTKTVQTDFIKLLLDVFNKQIFRTSQTIDWYSDEMMGEISGIALKRRLQPFENRCKTTERKYTRGLKQEFKAICNIWNLQYNTDINYQDINFVWTRNLPLDKVEEIAFLKEGKGIISSETLFGHSQLVEDAQEETERLNEEFDVNPLDIVFDEPVDETIVDEQE